MTQFEQENLGIISISKCNQRELHLLIKNELAPFFSHFENAKFYKLENDSTKKTFFLFVDTGLVSKKGNKTGYLITCFKFFTNNENDFSIIHLFKTPVVTVKDKDLTLI